MNTIVKKCFKSYLTGKKYIDEDIDKSYDYFKQCINIIETIKNNNIEIDDSIIDIIEETEVECTKYLFSSLESLIDKPHYIKIINDHDELFTIIEQGEIKKIYKYKYGELNKKIYNKYGLTPLHYAIKYGDTSFLKYAFKLGCNIDMTNIYGHTLLEYACIEKDPNIISFLLDYGADMKKHIEFRKEKKFFNNGNQIDILLLEKYIMNNINTYQKIKYLEWIFAIINKNDNIELELSNINNSTISENKISVLNFIINLDNILNNMNESYRNTYISIIKEELNYNLLNKLGCSNNYIEIILYNLVPFIDYKYNLSIDWLISLEIKYIILKNIKNTNNIKVLKKNIIEFLEEKYIKTQLFQKGFIKNILLQWFKKLKF
jgi:hypothetical protein